MRQPTTSFRWDAPAMPLLQYHFSEESIATLTLNRDDKRNAFNQSMAGIALDYLTQAEQEGARVVIIRANAGAGVWCAGHDLSELDLEDLHEENPTLAVAERIRSLPCPVIAMVEGSVHGGGLLLLVSADIVVASENADVAITSGKMGVPLPVDLLAYWLRVMGLHKVKELLFTAAPLPARVAWSAGLYNHLVPREELERVTYEVARRITACSPAAVSHSKEQLNRLARQTSLTDEEAEGIARRSADLLRSDDTRTRVARQLASLRGSRKTKAAPAEGDEGGD